jgi:putative membrane-bound dehydrogenase-like protein
MLLSLLLLLSQDLSPRDAIARMKPAEGFEVTLVASEPDVRQPVTMTFDERGRIWVLQYLQYPTPAGLTALRQDQYLRTVYDRLPEPPPKGPKGADRVTILEDKDGDGLFETAKDFVAGLNLASGMCLGHGGLFVAQSPYLLFYPDRNRDDVPDGDPDVLLTGFGMEDAHAFPNSLQWGPDGWLYGAQGSTVTARIRGIEFQQGIWRYHPVTKEFELFAEGGGNTWGVDFDRHGQLLAGTNFGDVALLHQVQGAYYLKGFTKHGPLHNPHTYGYFEHVPHTNFKGGHVTCGGIIYQGGAFPKAFDGLYIAANPLSNDIYAHRLERNGSTFKATQVATLLQGNDPWFRPIDLLTGPNGALYVLDWHDKRLNHVDPRDTWDRRNGRIYRIAPKGLKSGGGLADTSTPALLGLLAHPNAWHRREARRLLQERGEKPAQVATLEELWVDGRPRLDDPDEHVRAWSVRLLGDRRALDAATLERLVALARNDPSPVVRSQLACSAKRLPGPQGLGIVRELLRRSEDVDDPFLPLLVWWAIESKAVSDDAAVLDLFRAEAWTLPMVRRHLGERVARRYMAEGDIVAVAQLLQSAPDKDPVLRGVEAALQGRRLPGVPEKLTMPLKMLRKRRADDLQVLRTAYRLGDADAEADALRRASDPAAPDAERIALLEMLAQGSPASALPLLLAIQGSDKVRLAALGALQGIADPSVAPALIERLPSLSGGLRARTFQLLLARPASALALLKAVDGTRLPKDWMKPEQLRGAVGFENEELTGLIRKHYGAVGKATEAAKQARIGNSRTAISRMKPDVARGKALFTKLCASCHTLFGEGGKVAPDLTGADRKNLDFLLTNVIDPSALIRPEFQAFKLRTSDGLVRTGLAVEQTTTAVTLVDAQTNRHVIPKDRIDAMVASELSLMPEGLIDPLDDQETADLFGYLRSDPPKSAAPLKVVLVSGSLEYESDASLAAFQEILEKTYDVQCSRAFRKTDEDLPGLEALETADVMILFTRRLKPSAEQMAHVKKYLAAGKPVVGVRTASHAFQTYLELDKEVFGGSYSNHFGKGPVCKVAFTEKGAKHPILAGVQPFESQASLYKNPKNAEDVDVLLIGTAADKTEPLAWTRGKNVFYTSLGDQGDFKNPEFLKMLTQAVFWAAGRTPDRRQGQAAPLPGTRPLEMQGDLAEQMVAGIDRFLLKQIDASPVGRKPTREKLKAVLGLVDERATPSVWTKPASPGVREIRWSVFRGVHGEGLLLEPENPKATVIVIPDADHSPEELLARFDCSRSLDANRRVVILSLLDRSDAHSTSVIGRTTNQPAREFAYRPAFMVGRSVVGYEVQKVLALMDAYPGQIGLVGMGEGGLVALCAAALDSRVTHVFVHGWFGSRQRMWEEPIYRNLFGFLKDFGDAELAQLIAPRALLVAPSPAFKVDGPPAPQPGRSGAAPGTWASPDATAQAAELDRLKITLQTPATVTLGPLRAPLPPNARAKRQLDEILADTQVLLAASERARTEHVWKKISKKSVAEFEKSTEPLRTSFYNDVVGRFELPRLPLNPRARQVYDEPAYVGYEVVLDVWEDVYAYGILLVPKNIQPGEKRAVVVCQHGLEGRPQDVADPKADPKIYERFACRLAEKGYVTFAPQNPYIGKDKFRTLQRKANLLGKQLFSIIIPQHEAITDWLASLPFVDPERIAFYGLSYGGKTAMRVPAVVKRYCLSICSGDFNEWIRKNASLDNGYTYVTTGEYEIFEWNLGNTFNYAEMAALIAPRPFMVERGHKDGVAPDEWVAYEFAKVKRLYVDLGIPDRAEIEYFNGPHKINGVGTFAFLDRLLIK